MTSLQDCAVLITGASTGIGAATAVALAEAGADVGVNFRTSADAAREVAGRVRALGRKAVCIEADVCDPDQVTGMVRAFVDEFGRLDVVFANAGGLVERSLVAEMTDRLWNKVIALNLDSVFYTARAALCTMIPAGRGQIIVNASVAARTGGGGGSVHYATAKGALVTFVRGLAQEVAPHGVRINAVAPGVTDTPFHEKATDPDRMAAFRKAIPLGRFGRPEDIARAVVWLAGESDGFITGETLYLTGGM
jgi:3-oxoacyl-[acyl-carrier protein] reductase